MIELDRRVYTAAELAELLRVSKKTIYRLVASGELRGMKVGKSIRFGRKAVEQYLQEVTSYR